MINQRLISILLILIFFTACRSELPVGAVGYAKTLTTVYTGMALLGVLSIVFKKDKPGISQRTSIGITVLAVFFTLTFIFLLTA
ncbi:MAG: hypothetical protein OEV42_19495 [Deltaproteobacteria bacterium]|nr:hypothetical protein [Deltaproteobacteria bacterium]